MSANGGTDAAENTRAMLEEWCEGLAQVVESMAEARPSVSWKPAARPPDDAGLLWWEQPFEGAAEMAAWIATPSSAWEDIGGRTLRAAGVEPTDPEEVRSTWLEILSQSLGVLARSMGAALHAEVTCPPGLSRAPGPGDWQWYSLTLAFAETSLEPLLVAFHPSLDTVLTPGQPAAGAALPVPSAAESPAAAPPPRPVQRPRTMELLLDVELPVSISFGKAQIPLKDVLKLTTGSIIELNRGVDDPVEVLVNQSLLARGEVVVVDGNYGVRIQEIADRQDRLRGA